MIKSKIKLTIPLCGLLLLSSCRTEELLHEVEQKEELSKKFITFTKKYENDVIDYGAGFKSLALRYDSIHKTNMTGRADIAKLEEELQTNNKMSFSKSNEVAYIDFNVRSQLIEEENGDKWMVFPRVKGKEVVDLVLALLSEEETILKYYLIDKNSTLYIENILLYEEKYINKRKVYNTELQNYKIEHHYSDFPEGNIDEVIIVKPMPLLLKLDDNWLEGGKVPPPQTCGDFGDCVPNFPIFGGGGGGGSYPPPPDPPKTNPCDKAKEQVINNPEVQKAIAHLKQHLENVKNSERYEKGWEFHKDGKITEGDRSGNHGVLVKDPEALYGFYHNHTSTGVDIFSPSDIVILMRMAKAYAGNESSTYYGLVSYDNIHYVARWTGNSTALPDYGKFYYDFSPEKVNMLNDKQWQRYLESFDNISLSKEQRLERIFFQTLDMMGINSNNISLQKIDNNNNVHTVSKNTDGSTQSQPCN